jgi:cytochrome c5
MRSLIVRSILVITVTATAVFAAAQKDPELASLPDGPGKKILDTSCTVCHDLKEVTKFNGFWAKENWRDIVTTMVLDGARVDKAQFPVLVDYLARTFPREFPDGPEKKLLETACSGCHALTDIRKLDGYMTKDDWQDLIRVKVAKGAKVREDQIPILVDYLAWTFPPLKRTTASTSP